MVSFNVTSSDTSANISPLFCLSGHGQAGDSGCVFDEEGAEEAEAADTARGTKGGAGEGPARPHAPAGAQR